MIDLKVTKDRLKNHLHYGKWGYILAIALFMVVWSFTFSATAPKTPDEFKVDIYILTYSSGDLEGWGKEILAQLPSDQQEVNLYSYGMSGIDDSQMMEIIAAHMTAHEGDIYLMDKDTYLSLASGGVFIALDKPLSSGEEPFLDTVPLSEDYDLETLRVEYEVYDDQGVASLENAIAGVPLDGVEGLLDLLIIPEDTVAAFTSYSVNQENALAALRWIMENKREATTLTSQTEAAE